MFLLFLQGCLKNQAVPQPREGTRGRERYLPSPPSLNLPFILQGRRTSQCPELGTGLRFTCAGGTVALPAPGTGATARRFGSGLENELTRWKGASLHKWWESSLHRETRRVLLYFSPPGIGLQPGGRQRGEAVSDF